MLIVYKCFIFRVYVYVVFLKSSTYWTSLTACSTFCYYSVSLLAVSRSLALSFVSSFDKRFSTYCRAVNPPNFYRSLPVLRIMLRSYDSAMKTPMFCIKLVGIVVRYVRLYMALALRWNF